MTGVDRWVTVESAPSWRVELLRTVLEDAGIPVYLPDRSLKVVDPLITGGNAFSAELQVPASRAEEARRLLDELAPPPSSADDETPQDEVEGLAQRTRWAAVATLTFPFAVFAGVLYLRACRHHGLRSRHHGMTIAAMGWSTLITIAIVALLVRGVVG